MASFAARLDELPRPIWCALAILGFIFWWPLGLAVLAYLIWSGKMACCGFDFGNWRNGALQDWSRQPRTSGNQAFDAARVSGFSVAPAHCERQGRVRPVHGGTSGPTKAEHVVGEAAIDMVEASGILKGRTSKPIFFATKEPVMKLASITSALCATALLGMAQVTSALAQDAHQHTETAPPAAASPSMPTEPMQMMPMMQKMHSGGMPRMVMMGVSVMSPGGAIQNVEGHIAFLKAELKITDAQQKQWDEFADALRTNAKTLNAPSRAMLGGADKKMLPVARLEQQEKLQTLQLEALKRSRTALEGLNAVLSDEQKQWLDRLI